MKKVFFIPGLLCLFMLNVASMCSSDTSSSSANPAPVINTATQGAWRVTSYVDSGTDETNHFTGYNFTFATGNILTATNGTNVFVGSWSATADDTDDDNPSTNLDFNIAFDAPADFANLTDDWDIVSYTATTITLTDVSSGNGGTATLIFTKN